MPLSIDGDLLFQSGVNPQPPTDLVFGDDGGSFPPRFVDAAVDLGNGLTVQAFVFKQALLEVAYALGNTLTVSASTYYDNRVTRYRDQRAASFIGAGTSRSRGYDHQWGLSAGKLGGKDMRWVTALQSIAEADVVAEIGTPVVNGPDCLHVLGTPIEATSAGVHQRGTPIVTSKGGGWELGDFREYQSTSRHQKGTFKPTEWIALWQESARRAMNNTNPMGSGTTRGSQMFVGRWQDGRPAYASFYTPPLPPVVVPPLVIPPDLLFQCPHIFVPLPMMFGGQPCYAVVIPPEPPVFIERTVYRIMNSMSLKRVDDNSEIKVDSVTVAADRGSWCWRFSASLPYSQLSLVEPSVAGPVEVELDLNGTKWRFLIESYSDQKSFGKSGLSVEGRSLTAYLDSPYAPLRSYSPTGATTARAIADAELGRTGLETGFTVDWNLIDPLGWQIPANTWGYADLTPLQVIRAVAEGVGGYVNSHNLSKTVQVKSSYPVPPWQWGATVADKTIPTSFLKGRSLKWEERPEWNGVYVSGEATGILAFTRRYGTPGDLLAPMVVSPFITDTAAARERGQSVIASGGKQASVSLDLPMDTGLGLINPGTLIQVTDPIESTWKGLTRGISISGSWGQGLTITQRLEVERHY